MTEKISLAIIDRNGNALEVKNNTNQRIESRLEEIIADTFTDICFRNNGIKDDSERLDEKFKFAVRLKRIFNNTEGEKENAD